MNPIMLGGAPAANWLPLLMPFIAIAAIAFSIEWLVKFLRKRSHKHE